MIYFMQEIKKYHFILSKIKSYILDRRLCRELCRLPILWMKLSDRTPERVHDLLTETLGILQFSFLNHDYN